MVIENEAIAAAQSTTRAGEKIFRMVIPPTRPSNARDARRHTVRRSLGDRRTRPTWQLNRYRRAWPAIGETRVSSVPPLGSRCDAPVCSLGERCPEGRCGGQTWARRCRRFVTALPQCVVTVAAQRMIRIAREALAAAIRVIVAPSARSRSRPWGDDAGAQRQSQTDQQRCHDRRFHLQPLSCSVVTPHPVRWPTPRFAPGEGN
jgi:hypothetical protein